MGEGRDKVVKSNYKQHSGLRAGHRENSPTSLPKLLETKCCKDCVLCCPHWKGTAFGHGENVGRGDLSEDKLTSQILPVSMSAADAPVPPVIFFFFTIYLFYCCSSGVFCLFLPPLPTTPALLTSLPCFHPPLVIVHVSFIVAPVNPSSFSPIFPSPLPSGHCPPVLNFNVFGYFCFTLCSNVCFWRSSCTGEILPTVPGEYSAVVNIHFIPKFVYIYV